MIQNNRRTPLPSRRWAYLLDFLHTNQSYIKSLLHSNISPKMVRAEVVLNNILDGTPTLSAEITYPDGGNRVVVCTIIRPPLYDPMQMKEEIERISITDVMLTVSNQVEVIS